MSNFPRYHVKKQRNAPVFRATVSVAENIRIKRIGGKRIGYLILNEQRCVIGKRLFPFDKPNFKLKNLLNSIRKDNAKTIVIFRVEATEKGKLLKEDMRIAKTVFDQTKGDGVILFDYVVAGQMEACSILDCMAWRDGVVFESTDILTLSQVIAHPTSFSSSTLALPLFQYAEKQQINHLTPDLSKRDYRLLSLFSGAGGLDIGFEKAGFKTVWANEYDKSIAPSYVKYFPDVFFDNRSIVDIPDFDLPTDILGVIGGPPCQSWSEAGARRGIDDHRGKLFFEYLRVIRKTQPKFFVAENVHGMIHSRNKETFTHIISLFVKEGYLVSWKLLKASDYGVPQDRERVFIVGYHQSLGKKFEFPKPLDKKVTLRDTIHDLAKIPLGKGKIKNHELIESGYSPIFLSRNRVRGWDEQSFTILATDRHIPFHPQAPKMPLKQEGERMFAPGHEHTYRRLTVRECARIQTFPDDYEFVYTNIRNGYKMIGNAVPVNLAYHVAKTVFEDMKGLIK